MKHIRLEHIDVSLCNESNGVRVKSANENIILVNQTVESVEEVVRKNFAVAHAFYRSRILNQEIEKIDLIDIDIISINIVFHFLYLYNMRKNSYTHQENIDLNFKVKDFQDTSTSDLIINFYINKYPDNWMQKCSVLLGMKLAEFKEYYMKRQDFYNK